MKALLRGASLHLKPIKALSRLYNGSFKALSRLY
jgi:hypothetical protein